MADIIDLSPSQYRVVRSSVECSRECSSAVPVTARASRMSQFQAPSATVPPATTTTTNHHIYGIVNLALLAVSFYLLWANL